MLIFLGAGIASLFGAVLGAPTLRLRGDYLAIVTLGFGEIIPDLATNNVFNADRRAPTGSRRIDQPNFGPLQLQCRVPRCEHQVLLLALLILVVARWSCCCATSSDSRVGRAWVAIREDEVAAAATGINTTTTKLLAFAIGASVSGLAGAFYGSMRRASSTPDDFSFSVSIAVLSIIVLGGIGNIAGVIARQLVVIAFVIFWMIPNMQQWMGDAVSTHGARAGIAQLQLELVHVTSSTGSRSSCMMLLRPAGLLPSRARRIELESTGETRSRSPPCRELPESALLELDTRHQACSAVCSPCSNVSFSLDKGEILSMIGPNGAGKTTAFNCVTGLFPITSGSITLDGEHRSPACHRTGSRSSASRGHSRTSGSSRS